MYHVTWASGAHSPEISKVYVRRANCLKTAPNKFECSVDFVSFKWI